MKKAALILAFFLAFPLLCSAEKLPTAKDIISNLDRSISKVNDYVCFADAHYRKGFLREDKVYKIFFKRPYLVRIEVTGGDNVGAVAVLTRDLKVKGHSGGWLSWLVLSPAIDSPIVTTIRGNTIDQSNFVYMVAQMKAAMTLEAITVGGPTVVEDLKTYALSADYASPKDDLTKEMVFIDPSHWLIKKILGYAGSTEVVNVTYSDIRVNQGLDDRLFDL